MKHLITLWGCVAVLSLCETPGWAQPRPDVVVFDEAESTGAGYYDASVPAIVSADSLTAVSSHYGGKLPILTNIALSGRQSCLVEWTSAPGGSWTWFIASPGFQIQNLTGYSNLVLFLNGPAPIPAASLPGIGLESSGDQRTSTVALGDFLPAGLDGDTNTWQRVVIPLAAFQPHGGFSLARFKDFFLTQQAADAVKRTVWLDNVRVTDGHKPAPPTEQACRAGDRSVTVHAMRTGDADLAGYNLYRGLSTNGPFTLISQSPAASPAFVDFAVTNGQSTCYFVRALNAAREESTNAAPIAAAPHAFVSDGDFLEYLEAASFDFFYYEANPTNGLIRDRSPRAAVSSIAGVGFGLTGLGIAIDHGWITRDQGRRRALQALRTFYYGPQGTDISGAIGYKGWFYHMLGINTATRAGGSELSSIDTGLLLAGVLFARQFFDGTAPEEVEIRTLASAIFDRVDWRWMANGSNSLAMGWHPDRGFIRGRWAGYNEAMILYLLGMGASTNPLPGINWSSWANGYVWQTNYGYAFVAFPPLFGHQFSHCWVDFRHLADSYMNSHGLTYFENSRRATLAQRAYCIANPGRFPGYGSSVWGLTACDGPGFGGWAGYNARGAPPPQNDDGTIAPAAPAGSLPFAPEVCLPALRYLYDHYRTNLWCPYGFRDAFNLKAGWWDTDVVCLDEGTILLMVENYRSGSIWRRFMQAPEIRRGLQSARFSNVGTGHD
jgi:hypothetical protein